MTSEPDQTPILEISTSAGPIKCIGGHGRLEWRARTFYEEEPQTIAWLDKIPRHAVLWDIGANVGLYSLYAAKLHGIPVIAFEPESQNFALLCRNIALNNLNHRVYPACVALGLHPGYEFFHVREMSQGIAWSALGAAARAAEHTFAQIARCERVDSPRALLGYSQPGFIKIDVDGTEADVIGGAQGLLEAQTVTSLLVELNPEADSGKLILARMTDWGYRVVSWERNASVADPVANPSVNYIFERTREPW